MILILSKVIQFFFVAYVIVQTVLLDAMPALCCYCYTRQIFKRVTNWTKKQLSLQILYKKISEVLCLTYFLHLLFQIFRFCFIWLSFRNSLKIFMKIIQSNHSFEEIRLCTFVYAKRNQPHECTFSEPTRELKQKYTYLLILDVCN